MAMCANGAEPSQHGWHQGINQRIIERCFVEGCRGLDKL